MKNTFTVITLTLVACIGHVPDCARAAVVVVANKTDRAVRFTVSTAPGQARDRTLSASEVLAIPVTPGVVVTLSISSEPRPYELKGNTIYCFVHSPRKLELKRIGFTRDWGQPARPTANKESEKPAAPAAAPRRVLAKIPVKILVDQAEPTVRRVWEERLRKRIEAASAILERHCRIQLEVTEVGTWESDRQLTTLPELLEDFQGKVAVKPARLVIGFTGLLAAKKEDRLLGATPAPLGTHILIREWSVRSELDRLEILLHELGHFLGACHSPEADSVMRAKLGDGRANHVSFRIGFDPLNTLALNLVAEEFARRPVRSLGELTPETRKRLLEIFSTLSQLSADDPAASESIRLLGGTPAETLATREPPNAAVDGARKVVTAVVLAAERN